MWSSARSAVPALLTLLCFGASLLAQSPAKPAVKVPHGTVSGRVTIKDKAAPGVVVGLRKSDPGTRFEPFFRATTDQNGEYRITNVPPGSYEIMPAAAAYVIGGVNGPRGKGVVVSEDENVEDMNFSLVRGGVVTGKVTDAEGRPVIQQQVIIYSAETLDQARQPPTQPRPAFPVSTGQTDDRGIYRVFGLPAGRYRVGAGKGDDGFSGFSSSQLTYRQVFHPDASDVAKATTVELSEGSEANNIDIVLGRTLQTFSVSGRVIDIESGLPVPNVRFGFQRLINQRPEFTGAMAVSNDRGDFVGEGLIPGKYAVYLFSNSGTDKRVESLTFDVIDQDLTGLTVKLANGASVSGVVTLESEDKTLFSKLLQLQLRGFVTTSPGYGHSVSSNISPDGSFLLTGLPNGTVNFALGPMTMASMPKGFVISRVERDGNPLARVDVKDGEQVTGVKVFVSYGSATVRGVVNLENGALPEGARVFVRLTKPGENTSNLRPPQVDSRGRFLMEGIPAGVYELTAYVLGNNVKLPRPVKQEVNLADGIVTDVTITIDLATLAKP